MVYYPKAHNRTRSSFSNTLEVMPMICSYQRVQKGKSYATLVVILVSTGGLLDRYGDLILHALEVYLKVVERQTKPKRSNPHRTRRNKVIRKKPRR